MKKHHIPINKIYADDIITAKEIAQMIYDNSDGRIRLCVPNSSSWKYGDEPIVVELVWRIYEIYKTK